MSEDTPIEVENQPDGRRPGKKRRLVALLGLGGALILLAGGGYYAVQHFGLWQPGQTTEAPKEAQRKFIDLPEMALTLPNGGHPRQMRIRLSIEVVVSGPEMPPTELITPKVYDALLTYFRTLRDGDIDGTLALDRMRGDLFRRLNLVLGHGVLRDVLITSLVTA